MTAVKEDANIRLVEQFSTKRRWELPAWDDQVHEALHAFLLTRLESYFDHDGRLHLDHKPTAQLEKALVTTHRLADLAARDPQFLEVAELYRGRADFDIPRLVAELVESESVPILPVLRYKPSGLEKRRVWERTWDLQRQEDAIDSRTKLAETHPDHLTEWEAKDQKAKEVGDIPVPPKYASADFLSSAFWRLRGKLDVPKERWVSFPHCEGPDQGLVVAWAGLDHLELARAISAYYVDVLERTGGRADPRLIPLLAGLRELVPWLKQWHNEVDPEFRKRMGDYFEDFLEEEARQLETTVEAIAAWVPERRRAVRKAAKRR